MVSELNDATFESFVNQELPVVVDFYATWCGPCKLLSPLLHEIAEENKDQIVVGKLDVDQNPAMTEKYGIMSMPTLLVFQKGQVVQQLVGYRPKPELENALGLSAF